MGKKDQKKSRESQGTENVEINIESIAQLLQNCKGVLEVLKFCKNKFFASFDQSFLRGA